MSRHEGVSCDVCMSTNFRGRRYKCLVCLDYDLCASCYEEGSSDDRHQASHPMQCILTRQDFDLYYGGHDPVTGEIVNSEHPQSLTCPYCGRLGFTEHTLFEHTSVEHQDNNTQVVCPICASIPGGEPNHVTSDFTAHINFDHRGGASGSAPPREMDDGGSVGNNSSSRHCSGVRRMQYPGRGLGRAAPRRTLTFGSVGNGLLSSSREGMDPIAELLSQLTGVRRPSPTQQWSVHDTERRNTRRSATQSSITSSSTSSAGTNTGVAATSGLSKSIATSALRAGGASLANSGAVSDSSASSTGTASGLMYSSVVSGGVAGLGSGIATLIPGTGGGMQSRLLVDDSMLSAIPTLTPAGITNAFAATSAGGAVAGNAAASFLLPWVCEAATDRETSGDATERCSFVRELLFNTLSSQLSSDLENLTYGSSARTDTAPSDIVSCKAASSSEVAELAPSSNLPSFKSSQPVNNSVSNSNNDSTSSVVSNVSNNANVPTTTDASTQTQPTVTAANTKPSSGSTLANIAVQNIKPRSAVKPGVQAGRNSTGAVTKSIGSPGYIPMPLFGGNGGPTSGVTSSGLRALPSGGSGSRVTSGGASNSSTGGGYNGSGNGGGGGGGAGGISGIGGGGHSNLGGGGEHAVGAAAASQAARRKMARGGSSGSGGTATAVESRNGGDPPPPH